MEIILLKDLEFEIASRYEQVVNQQITSNEDCIMRKYHVSSLKHHDYLLAIPKNMAVCHLLDDMA